MVGFVIVLVVIMVGGFLAGKANPELKREVENEVAARAKNGSFAENVAGGFIKTDYAKKDNYVSATELDRDGYVDGVATFSVEDEANKIITETFGETVEDITPAQRILNMMEDEEMFLSMLEEMEEEKMDAYA